jgi:hypothetical protein
MARSITSLEDRLWRLKQYRHRLNRLKNTQQDRARDRGECKAAKARDKSTGERGNAQ